MKQGFYFLILFVLITIELAQAQNWAIINQTEKFNYRLDGDHIITATLWTDSIQQSGIDSVFFMNRILLGTSLEPRFSLLVYLFRGENLILRGGSPVGFRYANFSLLFYRIGFALPAELRSENTSNKKTLK